MISDLLSNQRLIVSVADSSNEVPDGREEKYRWEKEKKKLLLATKSL